MEFQSAMQVRNIRLPGPRRSNRQTAALAPPWDGRGGRMVWWGVPLRPLASPACPSAAPPYTWTAPQSPHHRNGRNPAPALSVEDLPDFPWISALISLLHKNKGWFSTRVKIKVRTVAPSAAYVLYAADGATFCEKRQDDNCDVTLVYCVNLSRLLRRFWRGFFLAAWIFFFIKSN